MGAGVRVDRTAVLSGAFPAGRADVGGNHERALNAAAFV